jgi:hypothetical protein
MSTSLRQFISHYRPHNLTDGRAFDRLLSAEGVAAVRRNRGC